MFGFTLSVPTVVFIIAVLISASATYNAYMLRGGKLAGSQILMVLGMVSFMLSVGLTRFYPDMAIYKDVTVPDALFVLGFLLLFAASLKLRSAFS
ncbi:hypothetical protein HYW40_01745 [Candidatus Curtissbacteria bacterium]|nr:hypothetical protein [Candidatus Curtissbacteria bacterium]